MMSRYWPFYIFVGVLISAAFIQSYLVSAPTKNLTPVDGPNVAGVGQLQVIMPTSLHVEEGQNVIYNTVPPTSGNHWPIWAKCGFYEEGLADELIVHNLEHSIIVISYNLSTEAEVNELRNTVSDIALYHRWGLTRFYDKIPSGTVAMAAWGVLDTWDHLDRDQFQRFFKDYAGKEGFERIPCEIDPSQMQF
jgi:hypothetical protein